MKLVIKMIYDIDSYLMLRGYENAPDAPVEEFVSMLRVYLLEALWQIDYANHDEKDRNYFIQYPDGSAVVWVRKAAACTGSIRG